jgi:capsular polysaccharide biosynthesis protein
VATTPAPDKGFDPEAEQEVDFARYGRMLARRWWLVAVGFVAGAVIGFLVSLGGTKLYSATSTIYLGQPYNQAGTVPLQTLQTNPSAVGQIANSQIVGDVVAKHCKTTPATFGKGISVQKVASASTATKSTVQVNPLVTVTVQTAKGKVAVCAANGLARAAVAGIGSYPEAKIKNLAAHIAMDDDAIKNITASIANPSVSDTAKAYLQGRLPIVQADLSTYAGLLLQAKQVEMPRVTILARERQVSAQSPRNTVLISALIGLILGVIAALLWDRIVPSVSARDGS